MKCQEYRCEGFGGTQNSRRQICCFFFFFFLIVALSSDLSAWPLQGLPLEKTSPPGTRVQVKINSWRAKTGNDLLSYILMSFIHELSGLLDMKKSVVKWITGRMDNPDQRSTWYQLQVDVGFSDIFECLQKQIHRQIHRKEAEAEHSQCAWDYHKLCYHRQGKYCFQRLSWVSSYIDSACLISRRCAFSHKRPLWNSENYAFLLDSDGIMEIFVLLSRT